MGLCGLTALVAAVATKTAFGFLGENVTFEVRKILYISILKKNIGWFDQKENGASVLTSAMASDTSLINGVSTESLSPIFDASFAFVASIIIGFLYCWQMSLIMMGLIPFIAVASALGAAMQTGLVKDQNELSKNADLLCGDAIVNYKTVQSFGHEDMVVKKY